MSPENEGVSFYPFLYKCQLCGNYDDLTDMYESELTPIMKKEQVCANCAFWMNIVKTPPANYEVINGMMFIVRPIVKRPLNYIKASEGTEFYIRKLDGTLIKTNNLWNLGEIPKHFIKHFPDTAIFLNLMTYQSLKNDPWVCHAKGCWDRYQCLRYDVASEDGKPFNIVPDNHVSGDERCPSFITKCNPLFIKNIQ